MLQLEKERWIYSLTEFLRSGSIPAAHWESLKQTVSSRASRSFCVLIELLSGLWRRADAGYPSPGGFEISQESLNAIPAVLYAIRSTTVCDDTEAFMQAVHMEILLFRDRLNKKNCISIVYAIPDISCTDSGCCCFLFFPELFLTGSILRVVWICCWVLAAAAR